jgi:glycosyltransferase involved in cell wall biosynthesis
MSNTILEAMACGLPIITTNTGGSSELVRRNGFIVLKTSVKELKEAIMKYIKTSSFLREHGIQSRKRAKEMSWGKISNKYLNIYQNI